VSAYQTGNAPNLYNADGSPAGQIGLDGKEYPSSGGGSGTVQTVNSVMPDGSGNVSLSAANIPALSPVAITSSTVLTAASHANRQLVYTGGTATITMNAEATAGWAADDTIEIHHAAACTGFLTLVTPDGHRVTGSVERVIGATRKGVDSWTAGTTGNHVFPDLFNGQSFIFLPQGKNSTAFDKIGIPGNASTGTATARTAEYASLGHLARIGMVGSAVAGNMAYLATPSGNEIAIAPSASSLYPTQVARVAFGVVDALTGCRTAAGFFPATPTNVDISTLANVAVFGADAADSQFSIITNDGTTTTKTAINGGTGFPCNTAAADLYDVYLEFRGGATRSLYYSVRNKVSGVTASGIVTANLPAAGTVLRIGAFRFNGANASSAIFDMVGWSGGGFARMGVFG